ncbi:MAG: hypothetical protein JJU20_10880 [Opitutales bacterium]|nr:hypothetical protein [Opitutales bacterium]
MKNALIIAALLCLVGMLGSGIAFAAGWITESTLKTAALAFTLGWFSLRLLAFAVGRK